MRRRALLICLLLSGSAGLAYELLWTRLLALSFGSTTLSLSTVLAVFFGGLGAGSWLAGRRASALAWPVRTYMRLELAIALFALGLYPVLKHLGGVFALVGPSALLHFAIASLLLLVPTLLMGATLPIACAAMRLELEESGTGVALVYGINTLGAFLGAYAVTYHGLSSIGVFRTLLVAVGANLVAAAIAFKIAEPSRSALDEGEPSASPLEGPVRLAAFLTFLGGVSFSGFEVVWARLFSSFLGGTIYGIGAVLLGFLVGMAIGSLVIARRIPPNANVGLWFASLQALAVASILLLVAKLDTFVFLLGSVGLMGPEGGSSLTQHAQLLLVLAVLFVPTAASGASFPLLVKCVISHQRQAGHALGSLYGANTLGAILGASVTGFLLIPAVGSDGAVGIFLAVTSVSAALGGALLSQGRRRLWGLAVGFIGILLVGEYEGLDATLVMSGPPRGESRDEFIARHEVGRQRLVYFAEGRDATVGVLDWSDRRALNINGLGQGSRVTLPPHYNFESLLLGWIPFAHVEAPKSALVVGLGAGATVELFREMELPRITVAEIEPRVVEAVDVIFAGKSPASAPNVELAMGDARQFLLASSMSRKDEGYDVITSMPAHPWVSPSLYTREFFELVEQNLSERGVFSLWFGLWRMDQAAVESVMRAFVSVFPHYVIHFVPETEAYYMIGGRSSLTIDSASYKQGFELDGSDLVDPFFLIARIYATGDGDGTPPPGPINTDDSAFIEVHAPRASTDSPRLKGFLPHEYVLPDIVRAAERRKLFAELLERLVGSSGGELPRFAMPIAADRAERTLAAAEAIFGEDERVYFRGRIALARGELDDARSLLLEAAKGDGAFRERARKFVALTHPPRSAARLDALRDLPPTSDILVELMELDVELALRRVPDSSPPVASDPIGWFLHKMATPAVWTDDDATRFARHVGAEILRTSRPGFLTAATVFCRGRGLESSALTLTRARQAAAARQAGRFLAEGVAAASRGRFDEAADLLWEANRLEPANDRHVRHLLRALVEVDDATRIESVSDELRFLGRSETQIRFLLDEARARRPHFVSPEPESD